MSSSNKDKRPYTPRCPARMVETWLEQLIDLYPGAPVTLWTAATRAEGAPIALLKADGEERSSLAAVKRGDSLALVPIVGVLAIRAPLDPDTDYFVWDCETSARCGLTAAVTEYVTQDSTASFDWGTGSVNGKVISEGHGMLTVQPDCGGELYLITVTPKLTITVPASITLKQ